MPISLKGRSLLTLAEFSTDEIGYLLDLSADLKSQKRAGVFAKNLANKNIAAIFLKPSARTRMAFQVAAADEGAQLVFFPPEDIRFGIKESVQDIARVVGRMFDGVAFRGFAHQLVVDLAKYTGVPVWNGLCDEHHPTQVLADLLTIREEFGSEQRQVLTYVGDGRNNQATTLMVGAARRGLDIRILSPKSLQPSKATLEWVQGLISHPFAKITVTDDADRALDGASAVYSDVWASMGEEHLIEERIRVLDGFKVTPELMQKTGRKDTIYLHCLPAFHDGSTEAEKKYPGIQEVSHEVFESLQSRVFVQAENRMHTIKSVMVATL
jgi:ornithine carbamoyltransferase